MQIVISNPIKHRYSFIILDNCFLVPTLIDLIMMWERTLFKDLKRIKSAINRQVDPTTSFVLKVSIDLEID